MRGMEGPQISASRMPTRWPLRARVRASWADTDDLPTPPFPERTKMTCLTFSIPIKKLKTPCCSSANNEILKNRNFQLGLVIVISLSAITGISYFAYYYRTSETKKKKEKLPGTPLDSVGKSKEDTFMGYLSAIKKDDSAELDLKTVPLQPPTSASPINRHNLQSLKPRVAVLERTNQTPSSRPGSSSSSNHQERSAPNQQAKGSGNVNQSNAKNSARRKNSSNKLNVNKTVLLVVGILILLIIILAVLRFAGVSWESIDDTILAARHLQFA